MTEELGELTRHDVSPGQTAIIRGGEYTVNSVRTRIKGGEKRLVDFLVMSKEKGDPLTSYTISRLDVTAAPYELRVCNGPVHEIDPTEVEIVD